MPDVDPKALFATFQKLLDLQARMAERRAERDRWAYEARAREQEHQQQLNQLKREFVDTLNELRKQLGLPDFATAVQDVARTVADMDIGKLFGDMFGDFFKTSSPTSA